VNYAAGLPWYSVTLAYQRHGATRAGVVHAPAMDLVATWAEGEGAVVAGRPAAVSATRRLADAVVSVVLTSHFDAADVARTAALIGRLGGVARGVRIIVSGGLEMCLVADGQLDAFVSLKADIVSHAAAMPLLRAAGGRITRPDGSEAGDEDAERIASNGLLHDELLEVVRRA
jgi:myo-inositol-1(or 4)-monophosphatase